LNATTIGIKLLAEGPEWEQARPEGARRLQGAAGRAVCCASLT